MRISRQAPPTCVRCPPAHPGELRGQLLSQGIVLLHRCHQRPHTQQVPRQVAGACARGGRGWRCGRRGSAAGRARSVGASAAVHELHSPGLPAGSLSRPGRPTAMPAPSRHKRASARTRPNLQHQVARLHPRRRHNPRQHAVIQHEVLAQRPALAGRRQRLAGPGQVGQPRASVCRRQAAVAAAQQRRRPSLLGSQILLRQPLARVGGLAIPQPAHCGHRWRRARPGGGAWLQLRSDRCYMPSLGSGRRT